MTLGSLTILFLIGGLYAVWDVLQRWKGIALSCTRRYCQQHDIQLLDDTLTLSQIRLLSGRLSRRYDFEFTSTGSERYKGYVIWVGRGRASYHLDAYRSLDE